MFPVPSSFCTYPLLTITMKKDLFLSLVPFTTVSCVFKEKKIVTWRNKISCSDGPLSSASEPNIRFEDKTVSWMDYTVPWVGCVPRRSHTWLTPSRHEGHMPVRDLHVTFLNCHCLRHRFSGLFTVSDCRFSYSFSNWFEDNGLGHEQVLEPPLSFEYISESISLKTFWLLIPGLGD